MKLLSPIYWTDLDHIVDGIYLMWWYYMHLVYDGWFHSINISQYKFHCGTTVLDLYIIIIITMSI